MPRIRPLMLLLLLAPPVWLLVSPRTDRMTVRLLPRPKKDVVRVGQHVPPGKPPSLLPKHTMPPTTHAPREAYFLFLRLAERIADRLFTVHDRA